MGAGGAVLGFELGMNYAFSLVPSGNPVTTTIGILAAVPVGVMYAAIGAAVGAGVGGAAGAVAGMGIHRAIAG